MKCPAIELLTEIRDRLRNLDTLEEKRRRDRERKRRVRGQSSCPRTKESEKGKETFPPAPPIEKREKSKKGGEEGVDARAREISSDGFRAERLRESRIAKVAAYNDELTGNIDAEYFVDYYADHWPRDWRARLRNWLKEGKRSGRVVAKKAAPPKRPTPPPDWTLCAERCANCDGKGCACGVKVPPACDVHQRPPEECPKFVNKAFRREELRK